MIGTFTRQLLSTTLSFLLVIAAIPPEAGAQTGSTEYSGQGVPSSTDELQIKLVAPIALYPDALSWRRFSELPVPSQTRLHLLPAGFKQNSSLHRQDPNAGRSMRCRGIPGVKALTQFPSVLGNLAQNLSSGPSALGEAYHTQPGRHHVSGAGVACKSTGSRESEIRLADCCFATVTADHRNSASRTRRSCMSPCTTPRWFMATLM